jgi:hypothetical protein
MGSGGLRRCFEIKRVLMLIRWYAPFHHLRVASVQDVCGDLGMWLFGVHGHALIPEVSHKCSCLFL